MANVSEFGKVEFKSRNEISEGYVLWEEEDGLVLEKHTAGAAEVVAKFTGATFNRDRDMRRCLADARGHVKDMKVPIYVDLNTRKQ